MAFDLGLFGEQLLAVLKDGNSGIPTNLKENRAFPQTVEAASGQFEASRHATELKTDTRLKTAPKPKNKTQNHLRPNSGQGNAPSFIRNPNQITVTLAGHILGLG